jgi:serine/threonine protein kinase
MMVGNAFGRFTAFGKIGTGGMGSVYAAFDHDLCDIVAIKTLISDYNDDEMAINRLKREASLYSQISHPNIVSYIESGTEGDTHYITLEYVRGKSLADIIDYHRDEVLTFDRIINIVADVARGLERVHELGILHRDIKPSNIILTQDDTVKLLDFGIALAEDGMELTATGMVVGTFVYSSPEQNQGRILDERSDLYSLGCVFFEMLTGQRALPCNSMTEVARFQALPNLASPSNFNPKVPPAVDAIVAKLLKPRARDRFDSASDLIEALETLRETPYKNESGEILYGSELSNLWEQAKRAFQNGDYDKSLEIATAYVGQKPMDAKPHFLLGKIYALKTLPFNATESFGLAIERAKGNLDYTLDFALALFRLEMYHQCVQTCDKALEQDSDNVLFKGLHMLASYQERQDRAVETDSAGGPSVPAGELPVISGGASMSAVHEKPPQIAGSPPRVVHEWSAQNDGNLSQSSGDSEGYGDNDDGRLPPGSFIGGTFGKVIDPEVDEGPDYTGISRRAKNLSSILPGLGYLYVGEIVTGVLHILLTFIFLLILIGSVVVIDHSGTIPLNVNLHSLSPEILKFSATYKIEPFVNHNRAIIFPVLAILSALFYILLWKASRIGVYKLSIKRALKCKIIHCREDGTIKISAGSLKGVEPGMRFIILKGMKKREISTSDPRGGAEHQAFIPIGTATVTKVRNNTSVATVELTNGISTVPHEGDKLIPG